MRITQISVKNLFGLFNHTIDLNMDERVTIIHGPNGVGKTIMLKMVDGIFKLKYSFIYSVPFDELLISFQDNSKVTVKKMVKPEGECLLKICLLQDGEEYYFSRKNKVHSSIKVISAKGERNNRDESGFTSDPEYRWSKFRRKIETHLIETQRLLNVMNEETKKNHAILGIIGTGNNTNKKFEESVITYSKELAIKIQETLAKYAELSQSLDRSFPARLLNQNKNLENSFSNDQLRKKLKALEEQRYRLMEVGLLDRDYEDNFQLPEQINEETKNVLLIYVEDIEKKLGVFTEVAEKINTFLKIINGRFLNKRMEVCKEEGFIFITSNGERLPSTKLSSGEQHELVLFYELLFKVEPDSLVMIDEPELSLHVGWQIEFISDIQKVTQLRKFDVLVATHSPQIINDRWDLTVQLKG